MKKGDLYYLMHIPKTKALVTKVFNQRKFHDNDSHFNAFPSISIISCVKILIVAGMRRGETEIHTIEDFNRYFRKIEVEDESR